MQRESIHLLRPHQGLDFPMETSQIQAESFFLEDVGSRDLGFCWWQLPSPGVSLSRVILRGQKGWQPPGSGGASQMGSSSETNPLPLPLGISWPTLGNSVSYCKQSWADYTILKDLFISPSLHGVKKDNLKAQLISCISLSFR